MLLEPEREEGVELSGAAQVDIAPFAAVTSARSSARHKLLASESQASVPAVSGLDVDLGVIDEHRTCGRGVVSQGIERSFSRGDGRISVGGIHVHKTDFAAPVLKADCAGYGGEQRVVAAAADVQTRFDRRTSLANQN
jgi:hypothetical protein